MENSIVIITPVGPLTLVADDKALTAVRFGGKAGKSPAVSPILEQAARELREYFEGTRREFSIPLSPEGTAFQKKVWAALEGIPYGQTRSYKQIAGLVGNDKACRAVGLANNRNPIPIIIPCHRVVGSDGRLTGYAGGVEMKDVLLKLEQQ